MARPRIAVLVLPFAVGGCRQLFGLDEPVARIDAAVPSDTSLCLGADVWTVCADPPVMPVSISGALDTDTSVLCSQSQLPGWIASGQPGACFVIASKIVVDVAVSGSRPLVLVASDAIVIDGALDVSSHATGKIGPAADAAACLNTGDGGNGDGAGGGAGGSFGTLGAPGGRGGSSAGAGGSPAPVATAALLRGGCAGGDGGAGGAIGPGGHSGGAVYLVAGTSITITGSVTASGSGGHGGVSVHGGGGGGGSGGAIVLWAPTIAASGQIVANGGGGGGGAGTSSGGMSGSDPTQVAAAAIGGMGCCANPADGGNGAFGTQTPTSGADSGTDGGGGGGGGVGVIHVASGQSIGGNISPPPS